MLLLECRTTLLIGVEDVGLECELRQLLKGLAENKVKGQIPFLNLPIIYKVVTYE